MWLVSLTLLAACASGGPVPIDPCAPWRPILVGVADALSRPTSAAILTHNETGARLCGWKGPTP